ncbi:uncharacterized protein CIMG_03444 [Coccidioides immitis RS]|uniref:Uncharacterized protein n=3 Tax=Coccidioides immitis TaxID=5501 RepID=J3KBD4_COCIM|nr:uncharacterized protein CIMG_03444 [Coccidioides immitis RS]EAS32420.3 hypothetical protein CIMG_03444 [Coccidioides immitis RS]KMP07653.1 hypothetical protein CIRG_07334 [Coccidioides immitis RMSCC 2394]KMU82738.1 hypothetical protein CIHG_00520 [Coccidioides immitis H538.4]
MYDACTPYGVQYECISSAYHAHLFRSTATDEAILSSNSTRPVQPVIGMVPILQYSNQPGKKRWRVDLVDDSVPKGQIRCHPGSIWQAALPLARKGKSCRPAWASEWLIMSHCGSLFPLLVFSVKEESPTCHAV